MITKKQVLENIDDVRKYIEEVDSKKDTKKVGFTIKTALGTVLFESEKTTQRDAILDAVESDADLRYADLSYANLRYANLSDADLSYADLSYANLRYANLSDANLSDADLSDANLSNAKTAGAIVNFSSSEYDQAKQFIEGLKL